MKKGKFLFIGINFYPEPTGIGKYTGEWVKWLSTKGYAIDVITGFPYYPKWETNKAAFWYKTEHFYTQQTVIHRCPLFVPKKPNSFKRILHELSFFMSALPKVILISLLKKPTHVICIAPPFHLGLLGYFSSLISKAKLIYHIQDLQIETAQTLQMINNKNLLNVLFNIESFILKKSYLISSIHQTMIELISAKTNNKVVLFPNWGNLSELYPKLNKAALKEKFELPSNKTIILYSGSVGEKQGLEQIISLSQILIDIPSILFVLAGTGHYFEKLKQQYEVSNKTNLVFKPLVPKEDLNDWLNMADFHIVFQKEETTKFLFPSKLASILSIGGVCIAIVTKETPIYKLFTTHNIGFTYTDTVSLSKDIKTIISKDNQKEISLNARNYAIYNLDMNQILENWLKNLKLQ